VINPWPFNTIEDSIKKDTRYDFKVQFHEFCLKVAKYGEMKYGQGFKNKSVWIGFQQILFDYHKQPSRILKERNSEVLKFIQRVLNLITDFNEQRVLVPNAEMGEQF